MGAAAEMEGRAAQTTLLRWRCTAGRRSSGGYADNNYRRPTALSHVVRNKHISGAFVGHGWYLLANPAAD